jgi:hypothetical protein
MALLLHSHALLENKDVAAATEAVGGWKRAWRTQL